MKVFAVCCYRSRDERITAYNA